MIKKEPLICLVKGHQECSRKASECNDGAQQMYTHCRNCGKYCYGGYWAWW